MTARFERLLRTDVEEDCDGGPAFETAWVSARRRRSSRRRLRRRLRRRGMTVWYGDCGHRQRRPFSRAGGQLKRTDGSERARESGTQAKASRRVSMVYKWLEVGDAIEEEKEEEEGSDRGCALGRNAAGAMRRAS
ncbi:hypothetical protein Dda_0971 [Drechslerella dactyloides]|uniref:Uncharacterized protein n=1 Tax=Drechslerella dactyloides TaxID=74499 RepID=A0AAD6NN36_DREDA|nr:hypothetical protein Dda_0971 [Drechslerella dactyloides]